MSAPDEIEGDIRQGSGSLAIRAAAPALNLALRTGTLATRFALIFVLAKYLDAASLGQYGLFTAAIGFALLCFGLDLYIYTAREISRLEQAQRGRLLKNQAALVGILYLTMSPLTLLILPWAGLPKDLVWWFLPILFLEHVNQEIYRLLIVLSKQITASLLLFIRQGSWAIGVSGLMMVNESARNLHLLLMLWACAGILAAAAGLSAVRTMRLGGWREPVEWAWIKKGISISSAFLIATLSVRAIQTVDRYWLQDLAGLEAVGVYVLFVGVSSALAIFLDAAIFSFRYPELVALGNQNKIGELHRSTRRLALHTLGICFLFALVSLIVLPLLLRWIDRELYVTQIALFYWILAAQIAYSLSMVPHYALYALSRDRPLIVSHLISLPVFLVTSLFLIKISPLYAVPVGVFFAMLTILLWKSWVYLKIVFHDVRKHHFNPL